MVLYLQHLFSRVIKFPLSLAVIFLLLIIFIPYGCVQQTVVHTDFQTQKNIIIPGFIDENDILSAVAQIDLITPDGYYPAKAVLFIKKPSYLRLELLPVIGTPDFFLAASPEKMSIFIPSKEKFYYGKPTAANLGKFLSWQFDIEDIVMIFAGTCPSWKEKNVAYQNYRENNLLRVEMKAPSGCSQTVWIGGNDRLFKLVRNDETGKVLYTVKYIYGKTNVSIPEKINISMADGITSLSVKYSDVSIEKATDLSIFDLPVPDNIKIIPLD